MSSMSQCMSSMRLCISSVRQCMSTTRQCMSSMRQCMSSMRQCRCSLSANEPDIWDETVSHATVHVWHETVCQNCYAVSTWQRWKHTKCCIHRSQKNMPINSDCNRVPTLYEELNSLTFPHYARNFSLTKLTCNSYFSLQVGIVGIVGFNVPLDTI